jgi:hypothetical protein
VTVDVRGRLVLDEMRAASAPRARAAGSALSSASSPPPRSPPAQSSRSSTSFCSRISRFHLYYANRAHMPSKLRAFIEFMRTVNRKVSK